MMQLLQHRLLLFLCTMLQNSLNNTTPIRMTRNSSYLSPERVHDKLDLLRRNPLNCFLHNMIPILILDATKSISVQLFDECRLLVGKNILQRFLNDATSVHLQRETEDVTLHLQCQSGFLNLISKLEEFL